MRHTPFYVLLCIYSDGAQVFIRRRDGDLWVLFDCVEDGFLERRQVCGRGSFTKEELMAVLKWRILVSITRGGGRGLQFDFTRRLLGVGASSVFPAKKTLRLRSRSNRSSVVVCSSGEVLLFGVGMNLRPRPSSVLAIGGRMLPVVRSWNARLVTRGK